MAGRNPARFLAPLALVAFVIALLIVVSATGGKDSASDGGGGASRAQPSATPAADRRRERRRKVYVVKPGDTPSGIAETTGVTLEQLEEANPDLDPQLLAPGQRIKLPR